MSGHKPFSEIALKSEQKTYELEKTRLRVNKSTWTRVLLDLFQRDKDIEALKLALKRWVYNATNRDSEYIKDAEFAGWSQCLESVRGSIEGYPHAGGDVEIMTALEKHCDLARTAGREDVLVFLRSFGYSEPPRLSGRGLAAMVQNHMARNDTVRAQGRAQRDAGTIAGSVSYPEKHTVTPGRSNGNADYDLPERCPKSGCPYWTPHTHGTEGPEFATMDGK
jgi:hypothetical protein